MRVVSVISGTATLLSAAGGIGRFLDIYNDSDTDIRIVYDGTNPANLVVTPGAEVGVVLPSGGSISLSNDYLPLNAKYIYPVYGLQASGSNKRVQIQEG